MRQSLKFPRVALRNRLHYFYGLCSHGTLLSTDERARILSVIGEKYRKLLIQVRKGFWVGL